MERARFVRELASGEWTMSELCEHHGVSRPTGYKWASQYKADGDDGLQELSRAPRGCPHRTAIKVEELVVLLKKTHGWGARKLHRLLRKQVSASDLRVTRSERDRPGVTASRATLADSASAPARSAGLRSARTSVNDVPGHL